MTGYTFWTLGYTFWTLSISLVLTLCLSCGGAGPTDAGSSKVAKRLSAYDAQVDELLSQMTLDERIGQMTQPDQQFLEDIGDIETYSLGSLLSGGDSDPVDGNAFGPWRDMVQLYQAHSSRSRLQIPLLYGVDAVHGHSNVIGAVIFPHNIGLGCTRNPELVKQVCHLTAIEMRATGIHWTFAPCVAVPRDIRWGRTYEGFSEDPELAALLGEAAVQGLQGDNLAGPLSVLACAKHYLGDGGTTWGTGTVRSGEEAFHPLDRGDTRMDEAILRRIHLPGYLTSLRSGVGSIMPSYSSWNGEKLSGHRYLLTDLLKLELGFEGFLISDYDAILELPGDYKEQVRLSVNAGMDMMMVPSRYKEFMGVLKELVEEGAVPMERIDDAVRRILRVKFAMGLFEGVPEPDPALAEQFGSQEHRAVGREAVRESLVLLKNSAGVLPISRSVKRIQVAGPGADDLGMQCGGWTIKWQGQRGSLTEGTTILEGLRQSLPGADVTYSLDGGGGTGADVGIVVIGEEPYAEFEGDREDLSLDPEDVAVVTRVKDAGLPTVVVILSGRPLVLGPVLEMADAVLAAWLPGTEGQGVVDVLLGDYAPTGKLSFSWPGDMEDIPIRPDDSDYAPIFPLGFGLSY